MVFKGKPERKVQMGKKYEIALSYAHSDQKIADILGKQLEMVFADGFFMDEYRPEELSCADFFREKLKDIFKRSDYAVILYSENYSKGEFTSVEMEQILAKENTEEDSHCFIINIDDCRKIDEQMYNRTYTSLDINKTVQNNDSSGAVEQEINWEKVHNNINDIVQNRIKKRIMLWTAEKKKDQEEYLLRIQTLCPYGNKFTWDMDYDWNILGKAFINTDDGRSLTKDTTWQDFWQYIDTDFEQIKGRLNSAADCASDVKWRIYLNCHLSVAYKLGQVYGDLRQASGNRNLVLVSSNRNQNIEFVFNRTIPKSQVEDFCREYTGNCQESADIACVISLKPNEQGKVLETVRQYLDEKGKKCCKIFLFQKEITLEDADMLEIMAAYLREKMLACRTGRNCKIHLFPDTTAPLMFVLGARSVFQGTVQLYEYIPKEDIYRESLVN